MNVETISRSQVGFRDPIGSGVPFLLSDLVCVTAHYVGDGRTYRNDAEVFAALRSIQSNDMNGKGYSDFMYNLIVHPLRPALIIGRGVRSRGAANGSTDSNRWSPSVLFMRGPNSPGITFHEAAGAQEADRVIEAFAGRPLPWVPHNKWRPTQCPGFSVTTHLGLFDGRDLIMPPAFKLAPPSERPTLSMGARDDAGDGYVHHAQRVMNAAGLPLGVDGTFGRDTAATVGSFQIQFGVNINPATSFHDTAGVIGLLTWLKIAEVSDYIGVK